MNATSSVLSPMTARMIKRSAKVLAILLTAAMGARAQEIEIPFQLSEPGNVSLAVYDGEGRMVRELLKGESKTPGQHNVYWDGLDRYGNAVKPGDYRWELLRTPGFKAEYLLSIGTNTKSTPYARWIGNHSGPSSVFVDREGMMYVGSEIAENAPVILKQTLDGRKMFWDAEARNTWDPKFGVNAMAEAGGNLVAFGINRSVRIVDPATGSVLRKFDVSWPGASALDRKKARVKATDESATPDEELEEIRRGLDSYSADLAGNDSEFAVSERDRNAVRWFSIADGAEIRRIEIPAPTGLAMTKEGETFIITEGRVVRLPAGSTGPAEEFIPATELKNPLRLAWDENSRELFVTHGDPQPNQVTRFGPDGKKRSTLGRAGGRAFGRYVAEDFYRIAGIASDRKGGVLITENGPETFRRVAHFDAEGKLVNEWYGGQQWGSFVAFDTENPEHMFFNGGDNVKAFAEADFKSRTYRVTHVYRAPDTQGLFPALTSHSALWKVSRRNGKVYLVNSGGNHAVTGPAIFRVDENLGELQPVARAGIAGVSHAPKVWEEAIERMGVQIDRKNISQYSAYSWRDANGDGRIDVEEVVIGPAPMESVYTALFMDDDWNVWFAVRFAGSSTPFLYAMPNQTVDSDAPTWNWASAVPSPIRLPAEWDFMGKSSSATGLLRSADGSIYVLAEGHSSPSDDRQADTWPGNTCGAARLMKWNPDGSLEWSAATHATVVNSFPAQFCDPRLILGEAHGCIVAQDRMVRPAQVFTKDGLYAGYFMEGHVDDGLPANIYYTSTTIGQPGLLLNDHLLGVMQQAKDGLVYWNPAGRWSAPIYRIHGWEDWERKRGNVTISQPTPMAARNGTGLRGEYFANEGWEGSPVLKRTDEQLWFGNRTPPAVRDTSGRPWLGSESPAPFDTKAFSARWHGEVEAPYSEDFRLFIECEHGSDVRVWLDDKLVLESKKAAEEPTRAGQGQRNTQSKEGRTVRWESAPLRLKAGSRYPLRIEYSGGGPAPQMHLQWESPSQERRHIDGKLLYSSE